MQSRVKNFEKRVDHEIKEKQGLLEDIESPVKLKLFPQTYYKEVLICTRDLSINYINSKEPVINHFNFELRSGERVFLHGQNGCGKSTFIKSILNDLSKTNFTSILAASISGIPINTAPY